MLAATTVALRREVPSVTPVMCEVEMTLFRVRKGLFVSIGSALNTSHPHRQLLLHAEPSVARLSYVPGDPRSMLIRHAICFMSPMRWELLICRGSSFSVRVWYVGGRSAYKQVPFELGPAVPIPLPF
jgi:hypothetical protein